MRLSCLVIFFIIFSAHSYCSDSESENSFDDAPEEPFPVWCDKNLSFNFFPDPWTFLPMALLPESAQRTQEGFAEWWYEKDERAIIEFEFFNGQKLGKVDWQEIIKKWYPESPKYKDILTKIAR